MMRKDRFSVVIYGSSLYLTAVATLLLKDDQYHPIYLSEATTLSTILHHNPALLLYQTGNPPADIPVLLAAGLIVVEIMSNKTQMTIFQPNASPQSVEIFDSFDFQTKITPFINPSSSSQQQINAAVYNETQKSNKGIRP